MGSGAIYAAIIVIWAVYFIPRWLKRHEELSETRSVEKFDNAMRVLSGRGPAPLPHKRLRTGLRTTSSVTVRRRRVLAALLLTTAVAGLLTPFTPVAWWVPVVGLLTIVGYLAHLRLQAQSRRDVSRTRVAVRQRSRSRLLRFDAVERLMTVRRELAEERAAEELRWQEIDDGMRREQEAEEERRRLAEEGWSPVPVPLPTYVSKPMAPRRADEAQQRPAPMSALLDDATGAESQLDAILNRRAVND